MLQLTTLLALVTALITSSTTAQTITPLDSPPAGYQTGFSTQDSESAGQQSICNTNCPGLLSGGTTSGPKGGLAPGVFAAAINPAMGGGGDDCAPCGSCYSVINSGTPLCGWNATSCPYVKWPPSAIAISMLSWCYHW